MKGPEPFARPISASATETFAKPARSVRAMPSPTTTRADGYSGSNGLPRPTMPDLNREGPNGDRPPATSGAATHDSRGELGVRPFRGGGMGGRNYLRRSRNPTPGRARHRGPGRA